MNTKRCDGCHKILTKIDDYFSIGEILFNKGHAGEKGMRMLINAENVESCYDMKESWCSYTDLDFCPECWKKEKLETYLK